MRLPRIALAAVALAAVILPACGGNASTPTVGPDGVLVANFAFTPGTLTIPAGTTVTWVFDQAGVPHNVFETAGPAHFESRGYQSSGTYHFTFTQPGRYTYVCQVHPNMVGTIVVT